jgi:ATP-dependent helicase/nuclease subunit A
VNEPVVQVLTIHQAKGLEFRVVVLWDSRMKLAAMVPQPTWAVNEAAWFLELDGLTWEEPAGAGLRARERAYRDRERERLVYVAATRARELLVLPESPPDKGLVVAKLIERSRPELIERVEPYVAGAGAAWSQGVEPRRRPLVYAEVDESAWPAALARAREPRLSPTPISGAAGEDLDFALHEELRRGRFGPVFGNTVHRALALVLGPVSLAVDAALGQACAATGLAVHIDEVAADVLRALATLQVFQGTRRLEYPVAGVRNGLLLQGYVDLVIADGAQLTVIDFKTDAPAAAPRAKYVAQVRAYAELLGATRAALLFTADGSLVDCREA